MKRYIRIYLTLLRLNFLALIVFRANFINSMLSSFTWGLFSISSIFLLTARVSNVYGWNREDLLVLTGIYSIFIGIFHMLFSRNFERFSEVINRGYLDSILLKPADSQFLLSFWTINYTSILRIIIGVIFTIYVLYGLLHTTITISILGGFFVFLLTGILFLYSMWFLISTIIIWFTRLSNLTQLLYFMNGMSRYPKEIFSETRNLFLFIFLPMVMAVNTPTRIVLKKEADPDFLILAFFAIFTFILSRYFWKFALRYYTSVSS